MTNECRKPDVLTKEYLEKKFSSSKYEEKYIVKCLQRDILDFQEFTKEQIRRVKAAQEELVRLIQDSVTEVMPDYEVKLYGSHATNLCLQWSDLDVVLIHKRGYNVSSINSLHALYLNLNEKHWKRTIKLIDSAIIPIIKMTSTEQYNSMHIDISIQDSKHYGLKCVDLVKSFMKEYEALEPLIFALKNILKNANLNDPYTV
jgi:non-canonical poly(A) RNA polymerase PAPD5/7